jgi:hypothetical protein
MSAEARVRPETAEPTRTALARLEADGFVVRSGQTWKTSRSFQRAMARAAAQLYERGDPGDDLRVPIALALLEAYSAAVEDETLAELVEAMLPIEIASLGFGAGASAQVIP